jgi:uncharacterized RDD family membrane protein YckC
MKPKIRSVSRQGNYAGAISRLAAFGADVGFAWVTLLLIFGVSSAAVSLVAGHAVKIQHFQTFGVICLTLWSFLYFSYQWTLSGKTLGMALFGLRVVTTQGAPIRSRHAIIRTITLPLSIAAAGLGLIGIVLRTDHRAWHDRFAGTCVVYDWDARAARLRWLAREHDWATADQHKREA